MSDKKRKRFFTLFFVLLQKHPFFNSCSYPSTHTRDKTAVFRTNKKIGEKKFYFFFIEQIVSVVFAGNFWQRGRRLLSIIW
jgi:hypothetical protein